MLQVPAGHLQSVRAAAGAAAAVMSSRLGALTVDGVGDGGIDELRAHINEATVQWALHRFTVGEGRFQRTKIVAIVCNGDDTPPLVRAKLIAQSGNVLRAFGEVHATLEITRAEELTLSYLCERLLPKLVADHIDVDNFQRQYRTAVLERKKQTAKKRRRSTQRRMDAASFMFTGRQDVLQSAPVHTKEEVLKEVTSKQGRWNWVLLAAEDGSVHNQGNGGFDEMKWCLTDELVLFGVVRFSFGHLEESRNPDGDTEVRIAKMVKFVFIHWSGQAVPVIKRGKWNSQGGTCEKEIRKLCVITLAKQVQDLDDLELASIISDIHRLSVVDVEARGQAAAISVSEYMEALAIEQQEVSKLYEEEDDDDEEEGDESSDESDAEENEAVNCMEAIQEVRNAVGSYDWAILRPKQATAVLNIVDNSGARKTRVTLLETRDEDADEEESSMATHVPVAEVLISMCDQESQDKPQASLPPSRRLLASVLAVVTEDDVLQEENEEDEEELGHRLSHNSLGEDDVLGVSSARIPPEDIHMSDGVTFFFIEVESQFFAKPWLVPRTFNQFVSLRERLGGKARSTDFPRKNMFACVGSELEERRQGLETWLRDVLTQEEKDAEWLHPLQDFLKAKTFHGSSVHAESTSKSCSAGVEMSIVSEASSAAYSVGAVNSLKQPAAPIRAPSDFLDTGSADAADYTQLKPAMHKTQDEVSMDEGTAVVTDQKIPQQDAGEPINTQGTVGESIEPPDAVSKPDTQHQPAGESSSSLRKEPEDLPTANISSESLASLPALSGYLYKKSPAKFRLSSWDLRFFVLKDLHILWWKNEAQALSPGETQEGGGPLCKGCLNLLAIETIVAPVANSSTKFILRPNITTSNVGALAGKDPARIYEFDALSSEFGRNEWMSAIFAHIVHAKSLSTQVGDQLMAGCAVMTAQAKPQKK